MLRLCHNYTWFLHATFVHAGKLDTHRSHHTEARTFSAGLFLAVGMIVNLSNNLTQVRVK